MKQLLSVGISVSLVSFIVSSTLNQTLKKVQKIIGYKEEFTWYAARGTFITRMPDIGVKPEKVAEMAGNSVATIYKYYFKNTTPDELFDTVAAAI